MTATTVTDKERLTRQPYPRPTKAVAYGLVALLAAVLALRAYPQGAGSHFIPGDAKAGMKTFFDKGCARCHAVLGEGGKSAPDLARAPAGHLSAAELVAGMWNHAPAMWERMQQEKIAAPGFAEAEMSNLFAFLYSIRSWDEPGDAERGRQLLFEKRCLECHAVAGQGGHAGPDLRDWASYRNPVSWIQAMWNHAPAMHALMQKRGLRWPEFQDDDVADLIAYIRTQATNPRQHLYLQPANPQRGRELFRAKGCATCHGQSHAGAARGPDLSTRSWPRTLGQFAGLMWNHSPEMWASMKTLEIPRPQFSNSEMADLIAYLFAQRYFEASGNPVHGARVFEDKGCASCHRGDDASLGPPLSSWRGRVSPIALATALWNHGPVMLAHMREQRIPWPLFRPGEMVDVMEYLNRGAQEKKPQGRAK